MNKIVLATGNQHKVDEFQQIFSNYNIQIISLKDLNIKLNVEETGLTFIENALLKAEAIKKFTDLPILADDSGIVVPELNNEPGIYSARYAGENASDKENRTKLLHSIKTNGLHEPKAYFNCSLAFVSETKTLKADGQCHGVISSHEKGKNGFGYDPIFFLPERNKMMAELSEDEKNGISHRRQAINHLLEKMKKNNLI